MDALVAPGPRVTKQMPWTPCELALGLGHEGCATLLSAGHKLDAVAVQVKTIQHRQITFSGHAKSMGDALGQKAFNEQVASNF
jgi:hypothetical protein